MTHTTPSTVRISVRNLTGVSNLSADQLATTTGGGAATALAFRSMNIARSYDRVTTYSLTSYRLALLRRLYLRRLLGF